MSQHALRGSPRIGVPVHKQHGNAGAVSLLDEGESDATRQLEVAHAQRNARAPAHRRRRDLRRRRTDAGGRTGHSWLLPSPRRHVNSFVTGDYARRQSPQAVASARQQVFSRDNLLGLRFHYCVCTAVVWFQLLSLRPASVPATAASDGCPTVEQRHALNGAGRPRVRGLPAPDRSPPRLRGVGSGGGRTRR
jgi:hypothetical protein